MSRSRREGESLGSVTRIRPMPGLVIACLVVAGCASGGAGAVELAVMPSVSAEQLPLEPGDAIRVSFSRDPGLNGEYPIDQSGTASLPLLGARNVTDMPALAVRDELLREYGARTRNQSVQVVYLRRIRVLGEVRNPGLYHVDPTMTFNDAVALAGGATGDGNLSAVRLIRGGQQIGSKLDVSRSVSTAVHSGDQIYVPKTSWLSRNGAVVIGATISAIGVVLAFAF